MDQRNSATELRKSTIPALMGAHLENQETLGAAMGLTQGQISRKLQGKSLITLADCDSIASHYDITTADLLSGVTVAVSKSLQAKEKASGRD